MKLQLQPFAKDARGYACVNTRLADLPNDKIGWVGDCQIQSVFPDRAILSRYDIFDTEIEAFRWALQQIQNRAEYYCGNLHPYFYLPADQKQKLLELHDCYQMLANLDTYTDFKQGDCNCWWLGQIKPLNKIQFEHKVFNWFWVPHASQGEDSQGKYAYVWKWEGMVPDGKPTAKFLDGVIDTLKNQTPVKEDIDENLEKIMISQMGNDWRASFVLEELA